MKPASHASSRSPTVAPMQRQTTPSVGGGGSGWSAAASPTTVTGTGPAIRARTSRGARPRSTIDGVARRRRLGAVARIGGHDGAHAPVRRPRSGPAPSAVDAVTTGSRRRGRRRRPASRSAARAVRSPGQVVARADRVDLGGAGRDDDLVRVDVEHPGRRPDDDHRPGVDRDDLVAGVRVEDADRPAGTFRLGGRGPPGRPAADDRDVDLEVVRARPSAGSGVAVRSDGGHHGEWRVRPGRMPLDPQPRPRRASGTSGRRRRRRPRARQFPQSPARHSVPPRPGTSPPRRIATATESPGLERDRPPVDDDPAAGDGRRGRSVTGASGDPAGRTAARAGAAPAAAAR